MQCNAIIYKKDCYRRTGRGKTGFEMHYSRCQCSRRAVVGDMCKQHAKMLADGWSLTRADYKPEILGIAPSYA